MIKLFIVFLITLSFSGFANESRLMKPNEKALQRIVLRDLKKKIRNLAFRYNHATGIHKSNLKLEIEKLQTIVGVILNGKSFCTGK